MTRSTEILRRCKGNLDNLEAVITQEVDALRTLQLQAAIEQKRECLTMQLQAIDRQREFLQKQIARFQKRAMA